MAHTNLKKYIKQHNSFSFWPGHVELTVPSTQQELQVMHDMLEGELSPENLCCDGELPAAQVRAKARFLNKVVDELNELGETV